MGIGGNFIDGKIIAFCAFGGGAERHRSGSAIKLDGASFVAGPDWATAGKIFAISPPNSTASTSTPD
ncbi:MAG: hypothetical protein LBH53_01030 [Puniceicoccales bacterium]|nr:hypothetical protein [Puniceicoccales bacterium]